MHPRRLHVYTPLRRRSAAGLAASVGLWGLALSASSCASPTPRPVLDRHRAVLFGASAAAEPQEVDAASGADAPAESLPARAAPAAGLSPAGRRPVAPVSQAEAAEAHAALARGLRACQLGDYSQAASALKQALSLQPFASEAQQALGEIELLQALAARDAKLWDAGRRLLQMACRLQGKRGAACAFAALWAEDGC